MTLDNQLKLTVRDRNESIESYYARIQGLLTLISSNIASSECWEGHEGALIKLYGMISLDVFIRGLGEPLTLFCKNYKPRNLAEAYNYCTEYVNVHARNSFVRNYQHQPNPVPTPTPLMLSPNRPYRLPGAQYPPNRLPPPNYQPNRANPQPLPNLNQNRNPGTTNNNWNQNASSNYRTKPYQGVRPSNGPNYQPNPYPNSRPFGNNWQSMPPPQPMEVDPSLRVRRGPSDSMQIHPPAKRVANIAENTAQDEPQNYETWYVQQGEDIATEADDRTDDFLYEAPIPSPEPPDAEPISNQ